MSQESRELGEAAINATAAVGRAGETGCGWGCLVPIGVFWVLIAVADWINRLP